VGGYPGDVDQNGGTTPFDVLAARQGVTNAVVPAGCSTELVDYLDINRDGGVTPFDILDLRRIIQGVSPATRVWPDEPALPTRP
jgi:dockerin type I repeat protein